MMDAEKAKKIARKIVSDGIKKEMERVRRTPEFCDLNDTDQNMIKNKVSDIESGVQFIDFISIY